MIFFKFKLNLFVVVLMLAFIINLSAEASVSTDEPRKRVKYLQTGLFGKLTNVVDDLGPKAEQGFKKVKKAYDAYDSAGKVTDHIDDCSSDLCTKFINHPDYLPRCAGCAVKKLTHPLDPLKNDDP